MGKTSSIFGNNGTTGGADKPSIFGNANKVDSSGLNQGKGPTSSNSIFSNFKKPEGTPSIFDKMVPKKAPEEDKPQEKKEGGIFSNLKVQNTGLFAGLTNGSSSNGGLFGGLNTISNTKSSGLFSDLTNPSKSKEDFDPEKEVKVNVKYDSTIDIGDKKVEHKKTTDLIIKTPVKNFKVGKGGALGPGKVSIERNLEGKRNYLLIFRDGASKILHSSTLFPKISKHGYMKGKKDAIFVNTISAGKDNKPQLQVCKLAFAMGEEDASKFAAEVQKIFDQSS